MKLPRLPFQMMRRQFIGLGVLGIFILFLQVFFYFQKKKKVKPIQVEVVDKTASKSIVLSDFNPNDLSEKEWQDLGFTESQAKTILKYKEVVGGSFKSKEQLKKCYAISGEKFLEIEPYLLLPQEKNYKNHQFSEKKELKITGKFNPDNYKLEDWVNIGFSHKQAEAILKYKNYLGGSFRSKEKFRECFIISLENYKKLAPYLILPDVEPVFPKQNHKNKSENHYYIFNPNDLDMEGWKKLGFSEKQAKVILNYKERNLKGSFRSLEDVERCFVISAEKFEELKPWMKIEAKEVKEDEIRAEKIPTQPKTDFSKIDINTITFKQLLEFGFEEKSARSFMGFRKKLGGFVSKQQILETYNIDAALAKNLMAIGILDVSKVQKYSLKNAPESFLKTHPYFRKYGEKILYYRISFSSDKEIFDKIKATPEEVAKMKLYLN